MLRSGSPPVVIEILHQYVSGYPPTACHGCPPVQLQLYGTLCAAESQHAAPRSPHEHRSVMLYT